MTSVGPLAARVGSAGRALDAAPPADRPQGRRGWRGLLAAGLALAAPAILLAARVEGDTGGGGNGGIGAHGDGVYDYSLTGPPGLELKAALAAIVLAVAAALVWTARRATFLLAGALLTAAGLVGALLLARSSEPAAVSDRQLRGLEPGLTRSAVEDRLGTSAGRGEYSDGRRQLECLVWKRENPAQFHEHALVCFEGDRFKLRRSV